MYEDMTGEITLPDATKWDVKTMPDPENLPLASESADYLQENG